jgi:hypothetical protein
LKFKVSKSKDFYAGLLFIFFGVFAVVVSQNYPMGSAEHMGPGYFPAILGGCLALIGLIVAGRGFCFSTEAIEPWGFRPLLLILGSVMAFAFLFEPLGLVVATLVLVVISCLGGLEFRFREMVFSCLILAAMAVGIFVYGLRLPFKVWPL